jgi:NADPH-dependent glutamate synthase beta subunit-like oxidoreductase
MVDPGAPKTTAKVTPGAFRGSLPRLPGKRAPMRAACPAGETHQGIPFTGQQGRLRDALEAIQLENPFPGICGRVCHHPCEDACNRRKFDETVSISALERASYGLGAGA